MIKEDWKSYIKKFNVNDEELMKQAVPNQDVEEWIANEVPKFECSNSLIEETYYFRWWVFRKHIKNIPNGRIITEFLPDVEWSGAYNSINCANGHHIAEARWLQTDNLLVKEYILFWLRGEGNEKSYSSWICDAVYQYALVSGDIKFAVDILPDLIRYYEDVEASNMTKYGLFWSYDDRDAMELSISGSGLRPTLNSYMYGNATAIAAIAEWAQDDEIKNKYQKKAQALRNLIVEKLWDNESGFFKVIPQRQKEDTIEEFSFRHIPIENNVCEEIGYIPWSFSIPDKEHSRAWEYLQNSDYFHAPYGITTAEQKHPLFMNNKSAHECQWNGPVWPFATTQTLNGLINLLQLGTSNSIGKEVFLEQMETYAGSHYRIREDGEKINWLDENIHPMTGEWISREALKSWGWMEHKGGYERGKDYNHSAFCDLVIRGLCGVQIEKEDKLIINPLLPEGSWDYFMLKALPYKNHRITIIYDKDGTRYGKGKGILVEVDEHAVARAPKLEKLEVKL